MHVDFITDYELSKITEIEKTLNDYEHYNKQKKSWMKLVDEYKNIVSKIQVNCNFTCVKW